MRAKMGRPSSTLTAPASTKTLKTLMTPSPKNFQAIIDDALEGKADRKEALKYFKERNREIEEAIAQKA